MPILSETTEVPVSKTLAEVNALLVQFGARKLSIDYDDRGIAAGMMFSLVINGGEHFFKLPVRVAGVRTVLRNRRQKTQKEQAYKWEARDDGQAARVAWRLAMRWLQLQLSFVQMGAATPQELFLPYLLNQNGETLFEAIDASRFRALPPATGRHM